MATAISANFLSTTRQAIKAGRKVRSVHTTCADMLGGGACKCWPYLCRADRLILCAGWVGCLVANPSRRDGACALSPPNTHRDT